VILYATSLGIGTCWHRGTFNRGAFANALDLDKDEFLPIITPIGYATGKQRLREKLVALSANASKRKPWNQIFYLNDFYTPLTPNDAGTLQNAFEMVRLAPSASNKQPWLLVFDKENSNIHFYLKRLSNYAGNKMGFEIQQIDIGIAMCHLECVLQEEGIQGEFIIKDPHINIPDVSGANIYYETSFKLHR
jgi:nitroreductase